VLLCVVVVLQAWQSAVPRDVLEGLLASEDLRHTHNLQGVAGCLVDVLDVPPQLVTAADVVAGNQLFQVGQALRAMQCHYLFNMP
jgi:hypothetical protein